MKSVDDIRSNLDSINAELLLLIDKRALLALEIKKAKGDSPVYRPERESEILHKVTQNNPGTLPNSAIMSIFTEILSACRNVQKTLTVAYLGPEGTYSHEAAVKLFGSTTEFMPQLTLPEVINSAENGNLDIAFLPIENSSEGAITETHRFLLNTKLVISGEYTLPIKHCLITEARNLNSITYVHAHPQALGQCREWLQVHLPSAELITEPSNSQAAKNVKNKPHAAAIASQNAARLAGIGVMREGINDFPNNKTRFIALGRFKPELTDNDKTSIICSVGDKVGALNELLSILTKYNISLLRLESQPHEDHDYIFFIDFDGHQNNPQIAKALSELTRAAKTCKILGSYPRRDNAEL